MSNAAALGKRVLKKETILFQSPHESPSGRTAGWKGQEHQQLKKPHPDHRKLKENIKSLHHSAKILPGDSGAQRQQICYLCNVFSKENLSFLNPSYYSVVSNPAQTSAELMTTTATQLKANGSSVSSDYPQR